MYPYAPILFDYIRRTMPMNEPQSLTNDQVYALAAYILHLNGLVAESAVMDANRYRRLRCPIVTASSGMTAPIRRLRGA
jgi:S-disulfanyl-L-cysteine oxidoreductase SoxD